MSSFSAFTPPAQGLTPPATLSEPANSHLNAMLKNGRFLDSPLQLTLFCHGRYHARGAIETLQKNALADLTLPNLTPKDLEVSAGPSGPLENDRISCLRLRWSLNAWYKARENGIDLHEEMEEVRVQLVAKRVAAYWACGAKVDQRCHVKFTFVAPGPGEGRRMYPLTQSEAERWVEQLVKERGHCLKTMKTTGFHRNNAGEVGSLLVVVHSPAAVQDLLDHFTQQKPKLMDHSVYFSRSATCIPIDEPTTIVSIDQGSVSDAYLLEDLHGWVAAFNAQHGMQEFLKPADHAGNLLSRVHDRHVVAVPSSVGLAEYIASQPMYAGHAWELAFDLNDFKLVPRRDRAVNEEEAVATQQKLAGAVHRATVKLDVVQHEVEDAAKTMSTHTINLRTFTSDLYSNLQQMFRNLFRRDSADQDRLVFTMRIDLIEAELRHLDREIAIYDEVVVLCGAGSAAAQELQPRIERSKKDKEELKRQLETLEYLRRTQGVHRDTVIALADHTGLGLTRPPAVAEPDRPQTPS